MLKMFGDKIKLQKIDLVSFIIALIIFVIDRLSKMYVIELIQSQEMPRQIKKALLLIRLQRQLFGQLQEWLLKKIMIKIF